MNPTHRSSASPMAALYALLIVYASLYPFAEWRSQGLAPWEFLTAPWPRYWSGFDTAANVAGYAPMGFLLALAMLRSGRKSAPVWLATVALSALSLCMESVQTYLPQRVPALSDWLLNSAGAFTGAALASNLEQLGAIDHWSRFRARWFDKQARNGLVLLAIWPVALLFPPAVPLGLGQVMERFESALVEVLIDTPFLQWVPVRSVELQPLIPLAELFCVMLGLLVPCLLAFSVGRGLWRRAVLFMAVLTLALTVSSLSAVLSYGPQYAWRWLSLPVQVGLAFGVLGCLACLWLPARACWALLLAALVLQLSLLNQAPASTYFTQTLQTWEQGRFVRFHGLAQWLGWLWPYAVVAHSLLRLSRRN